MCIRDSYNPVGSYICRFDLNKVLRGQKVHICFEGVEQAMYVWLNGQFVGYAEDSFTPSEFDLSPYMKDTGNVLAVEVHKRSTAAYLEDQDFFRFFGIFRDVTLYARPGRHVADFWIRPLCSGDGSRGSVHLDLKISHNDSKWSDSMEGGCAEIRVKDGNHLCIEKKEPLSLSLIHI